MSDTLDELLAAMDAVEPNRRGHAGLEAAEVRPDPLRERRKGVPEVVYAPGKTPAQVVAAARALVEGAGRALVSRVDPEQERHLRQEFPDCEIELYSTSRMLVLRRPGHRPPAGGRVAVLTAGTSDIPAAEEAAVVAREMGCRVAQAYDVGVAGLHRLREPLREIQREGADVIIVAAGMDGALPSVVSGLVDVPVIGLPTSTGYGLGGRGLAALLSMLQTCSPGLAVVNVDNGVGAGAMAGLIANRVAAARRARPVAD